MSDNPPPIRLKDIAARARVSIMTVSLALRNSPRISSETRELLQNLAAEMGYRADPMLSALSDYRRRNRPTRFVEQIALVIAHHGNASHEPWFKFHRDIDAVRARASSLGYGSDLIFAGDTKSSQIQTGKILKNRGIRGIIVHPVYSDPGSIALPHEAFATVFLSTFAEAFPLIAVGNNNFHSAVLAVANVAARGYKRPGLMITAQPMQRGTKQWVGGYEAALYSSKGLRHIPPLILTPYSFDRLARWVGRHRPDVIIGTHGDWIPVELGKVGLRVPEDIGYCGLDASEDHPHISGIRQSRREACAVAVDLLTSRLKRNEIGAVKNPFSVMLDPRWMDGATLRGDG